MLNCTGTTPNLCTIIDSTIIYLNDILLLLMAVAIVMFVWNIIKYYIRSDTNKKEAANYLMYSLIGFFVFLSIWGLVNILSNTFGLGNSSYGTSSWNSLKNLFPQ